MYDIYRLTCSANGKVYVGRTNQGVRRRFKQHVAEAKRAFNTALGDAIRLYGETAFVCDVIFSCETLSEAHAAEIKFIAELNSLKPNGYNICLGGAGGPRSRKRRKTSPLKGRKRSPETREKIRLAKLGKPRSAETKEKLRIANLGKRHSAETRKKMCLASAARTHTEETRAKIGAAHKGRTFRPESLEKMRLAQKGRKRDPEVIRRQKETWARKRAVCEAANNARIA